MARLEVKVLPCAVTDVNSQYVYFIERGELRAAEDFEKRVRQGLQEHVVAHPRQHPEFWRARPTKG